MTFLSMLIALIKTNTTGAGLSGNAWWYQFLTNLVGVEKFFMTISWIFFGVAALIVIIMAIRGDFKGHFWGGCIVSTILLWMITLPLFEWITWMLAKGMLANFDPVSGITNTAAFFLNAVVLVILGGG